MPHFHNSVSFSLNDSKKRVTGLSFTSKTKLCVVVFDFLFVFKGIFFLVYYLTLIVSGQTHCSVIVLYVEILIGRRLEIYRKI